MSLSLRIAVLMAAAAVAAFAEDDEREVRQIAFVDREGRVAAFTGSRCIESAGHLTGDGYSVSETPWTDRVVDLRVEDHPDPIGELGRLVELHRAYEHMNRGDVAVEEGDIDRAMNEYGMAARLAPENVEMLYWSAVTLATNGRIDDALPLFRKVFAADPSWIELTHRLQKPGLIPQGPEGDAIVTRILESR